MFGTPITFCLVLLRLRAFPIAFSAHHRYVLFLSIMLPAGSCFPTGFLMHPRPCFYRAFTYSLTLPSLFQFRFFSFCLNLLAEDRSMFQRAFSHLNQLLSSYISNIGLRPSGE
jgi:hypothetical protein